jgi:Ca2+-binding EF-hand superfamily protein
MKNHKLIKFTLTSLLVVGLGSSVVAAERGGDRQQRERHSGDIEHLVNRIFNALDTDENGVLSFDEYLTYALKKAEKKFARIDTDDDELLTLEEILAAYRKSQDNDDTDIDGEAIRQCVADVLEIDLPVQITGEERFDAIDTNDDGFIDFLEYTAGKTAKAEIKFARVDSNDDGEISKLELETALKNLKNVREVRKQCREQQEIVDLI